MRSPLDIHRVLYTGYYVLKSDCRHLYASARWLRSHHKKGLGAQCMDMAACSVKYSISFEDYYYLRFYAMSHLNAAPTRARGTCATFRMPKRQTVHPDLSGQGTVLRPFP